MNLHNFNAIFAEFRAAHDLPAGGAGLVGIISLFLIFKTQKFMFKIMLFLVALALFGGAYWWHQQR